MSQSETLRPVIFALILFVEINRVAFGKIATILYRIGEFPMKKNWERFLARSKLKITLKGQH